MMRKNGRAQLYIRDLKNGTKSLYINYRINGKRFRDALGLYLRDERTQADKVANANTMRLARAICEKKMLDVEMMEAGLEVQTAPSMSSFCDYAIESLNRMGINQTTRMNRITTIKAVKEYAPNVLIPEVNREFLAGFVKHLQEQGMKSNSIGKRLNDIKIVLRQAVLDKKIPQFPILNGITPKKEKVEKVFLTLDELKQFIATPKRNELYTTKEAFIFACFTGLRVSDIRALKPSDIVDGCVVLKQRKTSAPVRVPLSVNALNWLPEPKGNKPLFRLQSNETCINYHIKALAKRAGITKNISFHTSRHTCATLLLCHGADLYTVSKILGHSSINTTQVYAQVVDEKKKKAVELVPIL